MKLMIVESPNKVAKIKDIMGDGWIVKASVGHIRDLPNDQMGVEAPSYAPSYVYTERGGDVVKRLKKDVEACDETFLATDPDREGEAIAWHLKEALKLKKFKRITFDAINKDVISKALQKARAIDMNLVRAQEGRRVLDRLVGYTVSGAISNATGIRGLTAGRVQSPATRLVVERERQIQLFKVTNHFGVEVSFEEWRAQWNTKPYLKDEEGYILDRELAEAAASCREFKVIQSEAKQASKAPPAPFRSATLMQAASVQLGFSPELTMELAQQLFAAGHISYHRTDKQNYDESTIEAIRAHIQKQGWPVASQARKWKSVEGAQEGHEAIKPIYLEKVAAGDTPEQISLYTLIWKRSVASQMADATYDVVSNVLDAQAEGRAFQFTATGRTLKSPGWLSLTNGDAAEEEEQGQETGEPDAGKVPVIGVGQVIEAESGSVLEKKTKAPSRYTKASLVKKLEDLGIGRPSTYPAILKNIEDRGYIVEEKRKLRPTEKGMTLVVALVKNKFSFVNLEFTSLLEKDLDKIASGDASYVDVVSKVHNQLTHELEAMPMKAAPSAPAVVHECPKCGNPMVRIAKTKSTAFWGCSTYRDMGCKGSVPDKGGKPDFSPNPKGGVKRK